jgi:hypothetical protein
VTAQPKHTEARFEDAIEFALLARGYAKGDPELFDAELRVRHHRPARGPTFYTVDRL